MTLDQLRALADDFEWPIAHNKSTVTMTSALLFAQHVLQLREKSLGTENSAGMDALRNAAQRQLDALGGYRREIGLLTGVPDEQPCDAEVAARAALEQQAEPEPEPVAWMCPEDPERETAFNWRPGHCENCGKQRIPLYTAPPQRKPLTDEEIEKLFGGAVADVPRAHWLRQAAIEVVRKTERAHGIGEEYVAESAST